MKSRVSLLLITAVLMFSCRKNIQPEVYIEHIEKGSSITNIAQATLLANVANAMQAGGPAAAVEFCNLNASVIIDSLNSLYNCSISRVSIKNRNPGNALGSSSEKKLWNYFDKGLLSDTVVQQGGNLVYYKPIRTAMPTCLKCHGVPGTNIEPATLGKLNSLYPRDLATGYSLNDFRGLWKIEFKKD